MPRSKRAKLVHNSATKKKGKELTLRLYANIQECLPKYPYLYVFKVDNMRNTYLKDVRTQLGDSRLFFGKTKVMAVALGLNAATSAQPNTHLLTPHLHNDVGLLFSPLPPTDLLAHFAAFHPADYARAGTIASRSFTLPQGVLYSRGGEIPMEEDVVLAHSIEPGLRKLGLPTRLVMGRVQLDADFQVCKEGDVLGSGQTTLLKHFGVAMAEFRVEIVAWWERDTESVEVVGGERVEGTGGVALAEDMKVDEKEKSEQEFGGVGDHAEGTDL